MSTEEFVQFFKIDQSDEFKKTNQNLETIQNDVRQFYEKIDQKLINEFEPLVKNITISNSLQERINEIKEVIDKESGLIKNQLHIKENTLEHYLDLHSLSRLCSFLDANDISILKNEKPEILLSLIQQLCFVENNPKYTKWVISALEELNPNNLLVDYFLPPLSELIKKRYYQDHNVLEQLEIILNQTS